MCPVEASAATAAIGLPTGSDPPFRHLFPDFGMPQVEQYTFSTDHLTAKETFTKSDRFMYGVEPLGLLLWRDGTRG